MPSNIRLVKHVTALGQKLPRTLKSVTPAKEKGFSLLTRLMLMASLCKWRIFVEDAKEWAK